MRSFVCSSSRMASYAHYRASLIMLLTTFIVQGLCDDTNTTHHHRHHHHLMMMSPDDPQVYSNGDLTSPPPHHIMESDEEDEEEDYISAEPPDEVYGSEEEDPPVEGSYGLPPDLQSMSLIAEEEEGALTKAHDREFEDLKDGDDGPRAAALRSGHLLPNRARVAPRLNTHLPDCSVCALERNLCQIISGIFTRSPLPYGYNLVTAIPAGVCNVSIVEDKPSKNFFALRRPDGQYVLNGEWSLEAAGSYPIAGTVFSYSPADGTRGESLTAPGPVAQPVELMIIYQSPNPGIKYEYRVPLTGGTTNTYTGSARYGSYPPVGPPSAGSKPPPPSSLPGIKPVKLPILPHDTPAHTRPSVPQTAPYSPGTYQAQRDRGQTVYQAPGFNPRVGGGSTAGGQGSRYPPYQGTPSGAMFVDPVPLYNSTSGLYNDDTPTSLHPIRHHNSNHHIISGSSDNWRNVGGGLHSRLPVLQPTNNSRPAAVSSEVRGTNKRRRKKYRHGASTTGPHHNKGGRVEGHPLSGVSTGSRRRSGRHQWVSRGYTECSRSCGGGNKTLVLVCERQRRRTKVVANKFCEGLPPPPSPPFLACNLSPCPARWVGGTWSACSATCGIGEQTRDLICQQQISSTLTMTVPEGACLDPPTSVPTRQSCERRPCPGTGMYPPSINSTLYLPTASYSPTWDVGPWGPCSTECGVGTRSREVKCLNSTGEVITDESECYSAAGMRPVTQQLCDLGSCSPTTWFTSDWSNTCSSGCGPGVIKRRVFCSADGLESNSRSLLSRHQLCNPQHKPADSRPCEGTASDCGPQWLRGQWSTCMGDCGTGRKTRPVACVVQAVGDLQYQVVPDDRCEAGRRPTSSRECKLTPCKPAWFVSDWSECSATCGGGVMRRKTKCLSDVLTVSPDCPAISKPASRQPCNLQSCGVPESVIANVRLPDGSSLLPSLREGKDHEDTSYEDIPKADAEANGSESSVDGKHVVITTTTQPEDQFQQNTFDFNSYRDRPVVIALGDESSADNREEDADAAGEEDKKKEMEEEEMNSGHDSNDEIEEDDQDNSVDDENKIGGCVDRMKNCHLVFRARLCRLKYYNKLCCKTCRSGHRAF